MSSITEPASLEVSVIMPTYNRATYLREALGSVFDQTLPPSEAIVVDDGSSDATPEVVRSLGRRVRYERQDHQGIAAARNLGLHLASGDLIAWLDSDDRWKPGFLSAVVAVLEERPEVDGVYTGFVHIDAEGTEHRPSSRRVRSEALFDRLVEGNFIATSALVVRRRCLQEVGPFDTRLGVAEDYDMWLRLARSFTIVGLPQVLAEVRVHGENTMSNLEAFSQAHIAIACKYFGSLGNAGDPRSVENASKEDASKENASKEDASKESASKENASKESASKERGHAFAYRSIAVAYAREGVSDAAWSYLAKAVGIYPGLLERLDTVYELALGDQPRGYRGAVEGLDIGANGAEMLHRLDVLFDMADARVQAVRPVAYGNAHLALAMLSDQAGEWDQARRHMLRAIRAYPALARQPGVVRRFIKLFSGRRVANWLRRLMSRPGRQPITERGTQ